MALPSGGAQFSFLPSGGSRRVCEPDAVRGRAGLCEVLSGADLDCPSELRHELRVSQAARRPLTGLQTTVACGLTGPVCGDLDVSL